MPTNPEQGVPQAAIEALVPFAEFAANNVDEQGWKEGACRGDRIVDWFGPSEFRAAQQALATLSPSEDTAEASQCYRKADGAEHDEAFRCAACERLVCGYCARPVGNEWLCPACPPDPENTALTEEGSGAPLPEGAKAKYPPAERLVESLRWAISFIDRRLPFVAEPGPGQPDDSDPDWMEWASAHDWLKDAELAAQPLPEGEKCDRATCHCSEPSWCFEQRPCWERKLTPDQWCGPCRHRKANAAGAAPVPALTPGETPTCDCPAHGLARLDQHADECPHRISAERCTCSPGTGKKPLPEAPRCGGRGFQCTDPGEESYIANEREQLEIEKLQIIRCNGLLVDGSAAKHRLEEINATLKRLDQSAEECDVPPPGWRCTRLKGHDGPCAAWPTEPEAWSVDGEEAQQELVQAAAEIATQLSPVKTARTEQNINTAHEMAARLKVALRNHFAASPDTQDSDRGLEPHKETLALMRAAQKVRDGRWFSGAPSHVLAELARQLNEDGFRVTAAAPEQSHTEEGSADA
jgi:hypothetical protein